MKVAVVAHTGKTLGGGLLEFRHALEAAGVSEPLWYEVPKSRKAPRKVERALEEGADLVFAWGGDGMVQRCVDVLAGTDATLAVVPAGTANLFASNLGIPADIDGAVALGLHGDRRRFDVGRFNGERFAVMAGAGFDAAMIRDSGGLKDRIGRASYVWSGSENLRLKPFKAKIRIDGVLWYRGKATCILIGNMGELFAGVEAFESARPDDGLLDVGIVTADGVVQWARTLGRATLGSPTKSPFIDATQARSVEVALSRKVLYELDGGERSKVKSFEVTVEPAGVSVCVPKTAPWGFEDDRDPMSVPGQAVEDAGECFVDSRLFEAMARAGFVARGLVYGIIGILAFRLALGLGGKITDQRGAFHTVARQQFGEVLLTLVVIGLAGYSLWRLFRAALGHGPEATDSTFDRIAALGSGIFYAILAFTALKILVGADASSSTAKKTTAGVFSWPAGVWIVGIAGVVMIGVAGYQGYRAVTRDFLNDSKTEQMGPQMKAWITRIGVVGHLARMVVFALVGIFLIKAAVDSRSSTAVGLDGALAKVLHHGYGSWALGLVAAGLIAFALYSLSDARYRRI